MAVLEQIDGSSLVLDPGKPRPEMERLNQLTDELCSGIDDTGSEMDNAYEERLPSIDNIITLLHSNIRYDKKYKLANVLLSDKTHYLCNLDYDRETVPNWPNAPRIKFDDNALANTVEQIDSEILRIKKSALHGSLDSAFRDVSRKYEVYHGDIESKSLERDVSGVIRKLKKHRNALVAAYFNSGADVNEELLPPYIRPISDDVKGIFRAVEGEYHPDLTHPFQADIVNTSGLTYISDLLSKNTSYTSNELDHLRYAGDRLEQFADKVQPTNGLLYRQVTGKINSILKAASLKPAEAEAKPIPEQHQSVG